MIKSTHISWLVVSDINEAKNFYVNKLGLILKSEYLENKWIEVSPIDNSYTIGISEYIENAGSRFMPKPGSKTVLTFDVDNLDKTIEEYKSKNVKFLGNVEEIPGIIKMITASDEDGNVFQLCEKLN